MELRLIFSTAIFCEFSFQIAIEIFVWCLDLGYSWVGNTSLILSFRFSAHSLTTV